MNKALELFRISRPINCIITFASVWIGAVVAGNIFYSGEILTASLSGACIAAFGNIVNDILDLSVDKINKPNRPLVRGIISLREARIAAIIFGMSGLILSVWIGFISFLIAAAAISLLVVYTPLLKGIPFAGNLTVALVAAMAFVYGGNAVGKPFGALILSAYAFLMHLGREIVKDIEDRLADMNYGHRTAAMLYNARLSRLTAIGVFTILIMATFLPVATGFYGAGYFLTVLIGTDFFLVESAHKLAKTNNEKEMHRIAVWLKVAMPFGLLAVLLGHLGW
jgi:geranylgeranylglycerol-phosphate geranylgeranyltransferase